MDLELLLASLVFIVPMCFTPGPNNVLCAAYGSRFGFRATLPLIFGMAVGWSSLGLLIGAATAIIERYEAAFEALAVLGAIYIAYLGVNIAISDTSKGAEINGSLGMRTGVVLQFVNGKAWIHFLVLMTTFGGVFGDEYLGKVALVMLNLLFGLPAVMTWAAFGYYLRKLFTTKRSARTLNGFFGIALIGVSIWIVAS
ncbi:MAG: LysE family translocator [Candidatus Thalassarchaeaceae archaeon]|jgi:threonine/homoserine/homoserine lactone efflux protein|nr:LysE family translocator [Candidatus Thalassarchaeaceae archaeon]